ncbi:TPA: hypothetical protein PEG13_002387 [Staphylococcus aureus]|nr:hypothetical protein [Staphylococcus aureus]
MSKPEYQLNPGKINANTEETSAISYFSYQIENVVNSGLKMLFYGGLKMSFFSGLRLSYI